MSFFLNDQSTGASSTTNTYTYTPKAAYADMPEKIEVEVRDGGNTAAIVAKDQISMFGIKPGATGQTGPTGASPYAAILTNEAHTLPTTTAGAVTYTGSGTIIEAYKGVYTIKIVFTGTPSSGEFSVTAAVSNITAGANISNWRTPQQLRITQI